MGVHVERPFGADLGDSLLDESHFQRCFGAVCVIPGALPQAESGRAVGARSRKGGKRARLRESLLLS